ncbi:MAG: CPBP family intramembrane glutamic endopeptidase [Agromyces sp.]
MSSGTARRWIEVWLVLGLGLAQSAVYSIVALIARLTAGTPLAQQTAAINPPQARREWLDATYQLLGNLFPLVIVALALYLLWLDGTNPFRKIGLDFRRAGFDWARAGFLLLAVGVPGLGVYVIGRILGLTVQVQAATLDQYWWTVPVLLLAAARAALEEEVVLLGYLFTRLREIGWNTWAIIGSTSLLRGSYHLYQGIGPFFGNVAMGLIFGWCYTRWGRVMPLVIAHFLFDAIQFVGYPLAIVLWPAVFGSAN